MTDMSAYPIEASAPREGGWGWLLAAGIILVVAGIVAMVHPIATSLATGLVLGAAMVMGGAFAAAAGITNRREPGWWLYLVLGILALLAGIFTLLYPIAGALAVVWTIGAWLFVGGLLELMLAARTQRGRLWLVLFGLIDVAFGMLLVFVIDPISALFFLAVFVGVSFVLRGIASALFALELRKAAHQTA